MSDGPLLETGRRGCVEVDDGRRPSVSRGSDAAAPYEVVSMPRVAAATTFPQPEADYPVRTPEPLASADRLLLLGLLLLALIPRAVVGLRLGPVCDDGYFYLAVAEAYGREDYSGALHYLNINVYPVLLTVLDRLGFDPIATAKWWGVMAGTLVVLPLFGWLRRMIDRRVAVAGCAIYALHTEFIELSPEPIRDPTFWLFCVTGFYFAWRAATERALWLFASAGLSAALAAHTRTEGWLLLLPAVTWPIARWRDATGRRLRVGAGVVLCLAMTPGFVVVFNVTALAGHSRWEWGRLEHLRSLAGESSAPRVMHDLQPALETPAAAHVPIANVPPAAVPAPHRVHAVPPAPARVETDSRTRTYLTSLARTLEPIPLLLMLIGVLACPRVLVRREHLVLSACCAAVLIAIWLRLSTSGEINGRYFLLCFFPAAGAAGIGLLATLNFLERRWPEYIRHPKPVVAVAAVAAIVGTAQAGDALLGSHPSRMAECRLGEALGKRFGDDSEILVVPRACRVGYFAGGRMPAVMLDVVGIEALVDRHRPDLVIIETQDTPRAEFDELYGRLTRYGWYPYDLTGYPERDRFMVLTAGAASASRPLGLAHRDGR